MATALVRAEEEDVGTCHIHAQIRYKKVAESNQGDHMIYRQGDVLIISTKGSKAGTKCPRENNKVVLAYGEATGHAHAIASKSADLYNLPDTQDRLLRVRGKKVVALLHEEHAPIEIPPGEYIVRRQREYYPEEIHNVRD